MTEKERNKRLFLLLKKLIESDDTESIELIESLVVNDTQAMKKSFEIMTTKKFESTEEETWGKDLPMVYLDIDGWMVKLWKDGTIEKIEKIK